MRTTPQQKLDRIQALLNGATTSGELTAAFRAKKRVLARYFMDPSHPILAATTVEELYQALTGVWDFVNNKGMIDSAALSVYLEKVDHGLLVALQAHMKTLHSSWWTKGVFTGPLFKRHEWDRDGVSPLKFYNCTLWKVEKAIQEIN